MQCTVYLWHKIQTLDIYYCFSSIRDRLGIYAEIQIILGQCASFGNTYTVHYWQLTCKVQKLSIKNCQYYCNQERLSHKHFNLSSEDEIVKEIENFQWQKCPIWTEDLSYNRVSSNCHLSLRKCLPKQPKRHQPTYELEFIGIQV